MAEKTKTPQQLTVAISPVIAEKFRTHCKKKHLIMSKILEEQIVDYLIQEGAVDSWVALNNEQLESGNKL